MNEKVECKHYRISQIEADFEKLSKGKQSIKLEIQVSIRIPESTKENQKNVVEITPVFSTDSQTEILKVKIQGQFEILNGKLLSDDDREKVLEKEAVPILYLKLQNYIDDVLKLSNISFIGLPSYEDEDE